MILVPVPFLVEGGPVWIILGIVFICVEVKV